MTPTPEDCAVLIATKDRLPVLIERSLRSVARQTQSAELLVIVNDGRPFDPSEMSEIRKSVLPLTVAIVTNKRSAGAAGAWNSGLDLLRAENFNGFVALLDDDDEWDPDHLEVNLSTAKQAGASVVISGLRLYFDGHPIPRSLIQAVGASDFLVGNPGWQGSNTFVNMDALQQVGGFRDGLQSLNDRDLAYRLLTVPMIVVGYTGQWTATWHSRSEGTLSARRSRPKLSGLRWFWNIYGPLMSDPQRSAFFERAKNLFGIEMGEIIDAEGDLPPHVRPRGDLDGPP